MQTIVQEKTTVTEIETEANKKDKKYEKNI